MGIKEDYTDHSFTVKQIQDKYGLSQWGVTVALRERGVKLRKRGKQATKTLGGMRRCNVCGELRVLAMSFYKDKTKSRGYGYTCKDCCGTK